MPRVSVTVCNYNQPQLLKDTLACIKQQSFPDFECFVLDDGSDTSLEALYQEAVGDDARFTFIRSEKNLGVPHGTNSLVPRLTGDYCMFVACDERIWEHKMAVQVEYLDNYPGIDLVWGVPGNGPMGPVQPWEFNISGAHNRSREHWLKCFINLEGVPVGGGSAMWRRNLFDRVGMFDPQLTAFSDHEWFCRVIKEGVVKVLPFRFMNEVPGYNTISVAKPERRNEHERQYLYVKNRHPLIYPNTEGLVTVAMPCYNHAKFIRAALESVLAQTDQNFEILVMDDNSSEGDPWEAIRFLKDDRIKFFRSDKNEGHMATVNKMLAMAKGEFFISFSSDDVMSPNFIEKCRAEFRADPFLEFVASLNDFIKEDGTPFTDPHPFKTVQRAKNRTKQEWHDVLRGGNVYFGIGMYRTEALRDVGGWEPEHGVISDYHMYLKLLPRYNFRIIEENLTHTRIHGKNQSMLAPEESKKLKRRYYDAQKNYYQPRPKIIIATPFYELKGWSPYINSLVYTTKLLTLHGIDWEFMDLSGDSYVHRARNSMCMNFLADPWATDLFFIDSDMQWRPEDFLKIVFRPEPIIGGTYPVKNKWEMWTSKPKIMNPDNDPHYVGHTLQDGNTLIVAHQLAGGFLRIKRSVLEKFVEKYHIIYKDTHPIPEMRMDQVEFFTAGVDRTPEISLLNEIETRMNGTGQVDLTDLRGRFDELKQPREFVGEDYHFSNKLREMGVDLFIWPNASITHFGIQGYSGNFHDFMKKSDGVPGAPGAARPGQPTKVI